jgi:hypothetical protein
MLAGSPRDRRRVPRASLDEVLPDPASAEREALELARLLHERVAVDRAAARRLRHFLLRQR